MDFSRFEGKVVLVVNVASQCGYTEGHYRGLQRLHDILNRNGNLEILAFPCNQFGAQEPGSDKEISALAKSEYGVEFTMMEKVEVVGQEAHPVWKYLTGTSKTVPKWNFFKYLVDHHGDIVQVWSPQTPVEDIFEVVEGALHDAAFVAQVESPLGDHHDEL